MADPNIPPDQRTIFVISDLHLGGAYPTLKHPRGFRMCTRPDLLAKFIQCIPEMARGRTAELVINGDFVDFLAEDYDGEFRPFAGNAESAVKVLDRLLNMDERPAEATVFAALGKLLRDGHWLTVLPGNHDVELTIPKVRERLVEAVGAPSKRIHFVDSEEYVVGDAHIEHGNRFDEWNAISPHALARLRAGDVTAFRPPPGSELVARVMNPLKRDFPFIDLLKPEGKAAVPVLLALAPSSRNELGMIAKYALKAMWRSHHIERHGTAPIAATPADAADEQELCYGEALELIIEQVLPDEAQREALHNALDAAVRKEAHEKDCREVAAIRSGEALGWARLILGSPDHLTSLSDVLGALLRDMSFEQTLEDDTSLLRLAERPGSAIHWVVLGHSHLAKRMKMWPNRWYLNSGTWTDLLPFPEWMLEDQTHAKLEEFLRDMEDGNLNEWIRHNPTFVRLEFDGERVVEGDIGTYREA